MRQHEGGMQAPVDIDKSVEGCFRQPNWIVAEVPELNVGDAEKLGGGLGFLLTLRLDTLQGHAGLAPKLGRLAALAIGKADHRYGVAAPGMQRDRPAGSPHEVRRVCTHHQGRLCCRCHAALPLSVWSSWLAPTLLPGWPGSGGVPWV